MLIAYYKAFEPPVYSAILLERR